SDAEPTLPYSGSGTNKTIGQSLRKGENVLRKVLTPGDWTLWIYESTGEKSDELQTLAPCTPFSFKIDISTDNLQETLVSCLAPRLPEQLLPGFDNPPGFIHYRENALV